MIEKDLDNNFVKRISTSFDIEEETNDKFIAFCKNQGMNRSRVIEKLIKNFIKVNTVE